MTHTPPSPVTPRMTPAQSASREMPGVEPGFTAIPNRTAEGLSAWPFSLASLKLYIYLCRQSWGWRNKATKSCYCRKCIAQATNMHVSTVSIALTVLEKAGLVEFRSDGRIDLDLNGPEAYRAKVPRCPEHTSLKYEHPEGVAKRQRRRCQSATRALRNGNTKRLHADVSSSVTSPEKKLLKKEKEIRTSSASPGAFQISQNKSVTDVITDARKTHSQRRVAELSHCLPTDQNAHLGGRGSCRAAVAAIRDTSQNAAGHASVKSHELCIGNQGGSAGASPSRSHTPWQISERASTDPNQLSTRERQDPRFRAVAVAWIRKCPHEPERAGSVDSWTGRLIQIAERLNVSPHILIRSVPDGAASPRGYVRGFESGAYPLPAWTEDPAHKQTFYDWVCGPDDRRSRL